MVVLQLFAADVIQIHTQMNAKHTLVYWVRMGWGFMLFFIKLYLGKLGLCTFFAVGANKRKAKRHLKGYKSCSLWEYNKEFITSLVEIRYGYMVEGF